MAKKKKNVAVGGGHKMTPTEEQKKEKKIEFMPVKKFSCKQVGPNENEVFVDGLLDCVGDFARDMNNRLNMKADEKGGLKNWDHLHPEELIRLAKKHISEVSERITAREDEHIIKRCVDAANYLMMIADMKRTK